MTEGRLRGSGQVVAVKRPTRSSFHAGALLEAESAVLRSARHPRLVSSMGIADDGQALLLAPRCCGSLAEWTHPPLDPSEVAGLVRDAAEALSAVHEAGWVHGRVDATHVLVGPDGRAILAGLGRARRADPAAGADPAGDVAALAELARGLLEPTATDPIAVGLRSALRRMTAAEPRRRPSALSSAELVTRLGPPPAPLAPPMPDDDRSAGDATTAGSDGPRPPGEGIPGRSERTGRQHRSTRHLVLILVVLAVIAAILAAGLGDDGGHLARPLPCAPDTWPPPQPGATDLMADVGGEGCTRAVRWYRATGLVEVADDDGLRRYAVGRGGDALHLADWDCDGRATPAVVRAGEDVAWHFDRWPSNEDPVTPRPRPLGPDGKPIVPSCAASAATGRTVGP